MDEGRENEEETSGWEGEMNEGRENEEEETRGWEGGTNEGRENEEEEEETGGWVRFVEGKVGAGGR